MSLIGVYDLWYQDVLLSNLQLTTTSNLKAIAYPFPVSLLHDTQTHNASASAVIWNYDSTTYKDLSENNATFIKLCPEDARCCVKHQTQYMPWYYNTKMVIHIENIQDFILFFDTCR